MAPGAAIIPKQISGGQSNTVASIELPSVNEACDHYATVKTRLMDINNWGQISNNLAEFKLTDAEGNLKMSRPEEGDHIRINLPAPGTAGSGAYEWVMIEYIVSKSSIMADYESAALLVRPAPNPVRGGGEIAHFFKDDATSTFLVRRDGNTIIAGVHGRNETPNTDVYTLLDSIRNIIVGIGAILGFSKVQWKSLVNGLISLPEYKKP